MKIKFHKKIKFYTIMPSIKFIRKLLGIIYSIQSVESLKHQKYMISVLFMVMKIKLKKKDTYLCSYLKETMEINLLSVIKKIKFDTNKNNLF